MAAWVDAYRQAWNTNDPADIAGLFTEDARYYASPFEAPWTGRDAIVAEWLARQDAPGSTTFRYEVLAVSGDTGVVRGWTHYHEPPREFSNVWLVRFGPGGRCREFTEWWIQRPEG